LISLRHVRCFLAVAEHGSTAAAARRLHISQPAVSVAIKELEALLGRPLFDRLPARGLVPTRFGLGKLSQAQSLAAGIAAFGSPGSADGAATGHVTFGYFTTLGPQYVPGILRRMGRRCPRVTVTPVEADLDELIALLESGRVELGLTYEVRPAPRVSAERIAQLAPYAVLPARHPLARKASVTPAELAADPFILIDLPSSRDFLLSVFRTAGIEPTIAHRTHSLEMVFGMVANELGVSVLVTKPAGSRAYDGKRVARVPLPRTTIRQGVAISWPAWSAPTAPALALARCIREQVAAATTESM
jgi:DNA-binding transcriptional LysR family regulator